MPYGIKNDGHNKYYVQNLDSGKVYSGYPLDLSTAKKQLMALSLYGGGINEFKHHAHHYYKQIFTEPEDIGKAMLYFKHAVIKRFQLVFVENNLFAIFELLTPGGYFHLATWKDSEIKFQLIKDFIVSPKYPSTQIYNDPKNYTFENILITTKHFLPKSYSNGEYLSALSKAFKLKYYSEFAEKYAMHGGDVISTNPNLPEEGEDQYKNWDFEFREEYDVYVPVEAENGRSYLDYRLISQYQAKMEQYALNEAITPQTLDTIGGPAASAAIEAGTMVAEELSEEVPMLPQLIEAGKALANALISAFYHPKTSVALKLQKAGIDVYLTQTVLTNGDYDRNDTRHYGFTIPNTNISVDLVDQYIFSMISGFVLIHGTNPIIISSLIPQNIKDAIAKIPNWNDIYEGLAKYHGLENVSLFSKVLDE